MTQEALLDFEHIGDTLEEAGGMFLTNEEREVIAYYWKEFMKTYKFLDCKWYDLFWSNFDQEYDDGRDFNDQCREFMTSVILDVINNRSGMIDTIWQIYYNINFVFEQDNKFVAEDFVQFVLSESIKKVEEFENNVAEYNS